MNSLATKIGTHLQNQFGPTIDGIKDSLDVLKAGQDMVSTVVHDVTGQDVNIRSIQKGAADFDEKWDAFVKEINSKFNTASTNGQADIMETFVKSHFGDDVYNLGSAIKNELPNVLDGIADYQETINSISSNSKTVEEAATKINNSVEKMVKATEKIASSINNAVEICTGKGIPVLDELSKIGSSADVVNLNKALNIGMAGAKAATAANQLKQSIKNKDLRGITDAMAKGATSVNSLMSQLQQVIPGFPNAQIPVKITDSIKRLQNAQSVYDAAGSMVTALVADASGRHDLSSFATLASNFNQNWDTFSSKIDTLFNIAPANGQQAVLETLAKNMFGENVFYAAGAVKRQTPGFLSGLAGVQDAIKQLGGSYRNPIEAVTKIRNCTEKIVQSVEKIGQSLNNMVKYYQGKGDITKGTGYPLLEMMGNLGDTKGIKALDYVLRTAGGTAAIVGNAGAVAQAIKNKDISGAIAAVKKTIDDFKNLTKKGNYKAQGNDKGALPNNDNSKSSSPPNEQQEKQKSQLSSGQTDSYVCSGATMRCTMGTSKAKLTVLPTRTVYLTGQPMANISDHLSMINLAPFGNCRSMGFPATAAATAANYGTLTPQPCMHNTPFPWMSGKNDYIINGDPALLKSSTCQCMWGGTISITDDGQGAGSPDMSRKAKEEFEKDQIDTEGLDTESVLDGIQMALDMAGMIPGVGAAPDLLNAAISACRGDWLGAGMSLVAAVPGAGDAVGAAKIAKNGVKLAKQVKNGTMSAETAVKTAKNAEKLTNNTDNVVSLAEKRASKLERQRSKNVLRIDNYKVEVKKQGNGPEQRTLKKISDKEVITVKNSSGTGGVNSSPSGFDKPDNVNSVKSVGGTGSSTDKRGTTFWNQSEQNIKKPKEGEDNILEFRRRPPLQEGRGNKLDLDS